MLELAKRRISDGSGLGWVFRSIFFFKKTLGWAGVAIATPCLKQIRPWSPGHTHQAAVLC